MPYLSPDDLATSLPRFKCHKIVQAAKILDVLSRPLRLRLDCHAPDGERALHDPSAATAWFQPRPDLGTSRMPQPGDYLVRYDDGYLSISPAKAFEEGYALLPPPAEARSFGKVCGELFDQAGETCSCLRPWGHPGKHGEPGDMGESPIRCLAVHHHAGQCERGEGHSGLHITGKGPTAFGWRPASGIICGHPVGTRACNRTLHHDGPHEVGESFLDRRPADANDGQFV